MEAPVGLLPGSTSLCTTAYEGVPGLAGLGKTVEPAPRARSRSLMSYRDMYAPRSKAISSDIRLHGSAKVPTSTPAGSLNSGVS